MPIDYHSKINASRLGEMAFAVIFAGTCFAGIGTTKADIRVGQAVHARLLDIMTRDPGRPPMAGTRTHAATGVHGRQR
jgi:hypothetical protein